MPRVTDTKVCATCEVTYPHHPYLYVECPSCGAKPGQACQRPSDHDAQNDIHEERGDAAFEAGVAICPGEDPETAVLPRDAQVGDDVPFDLDAITITDPEEVTVVQG